MYKCDIGYVYFALTSRQGSGKTHLAKEIGNQTARLVKQQRKQTIRPVKQHGNRTARPVKQQRKQTIRPVSYLGYKVSDLDFLNIVETSRLGTSFKTAQSTKQLGNQTARLVKQHRKQRIRPVSYLGYKVSDLDFLNIVETSRLGTSFKTVETSRLGTSFKTAQTSRLGTSFKTVETSRPESCDDTVNDIYNIFKEA